MLRAFYIENKSILSTDNHKVLLNLKPGKILWVDFEGLEAQDEELLQHFTIDPNSLKNKAEEIESSSRFYETDDSVVINTNILSFRQKEIIEDNLSIIVKNRIVFTFRKKQASWLSDLELRVKQSNPETIDSLRVILQLLESRIDLDADLIESLSRSITFISKQISFSRKLEEEVILEINQLQENFMIIREALMEKQRILSGALKSDLFPDSDYEKIRIMLKDVGSLIDHTTFNFERLDYLQHAFLGLVNIEQNRVIKLFTVVTVIMMPPTLIASCEGMNFDNMPELSWDFGYPLAIILMLVSSLLTLFYFRKKGWL
jgi:magnesium transporter